MGGPWQSASPKRGDFCPCFTCRWEGGRALLPSCVSLSLSLIGGVHCLAFCPVVIVAALGVCLCVLKAVSVAPRELAISNKSRFRARVSASEEQS